MEGGIDAFCTYILSTVCIYGGIVLAAAAAIVARKDCIRRVPLLIVHGLMWNDSVGLDFFLARLSGVPAARALFVVGGEIRCLAVILLLDVALFSVVRLLSTLSSVIYGGCSADAAGCSTIGPLHPLWLSPPVV